MGVSGLFWYQLSLRGDQSKLDCSVQQRYRVDFVCDRAVDVDGNCMSDSRLKG